MSVLYVDSLQPNLGSRVMAAGHVVQVVTSAVASDGVAISTVSNSASVATGYYCDITPTSASSKILVIVTSNIQHSGSTNQGAVWGVRRDGILVSSTSNLGYIEYSVGDTSYHSTVTTNVLDAPNTTSSVRYELYLSNYLGGTAQVRNWGNTSITLMEIAQ